MLFSACRAFHTSLISVFLFFFPIATESAEMGEQIQSLFSYSDFAKISSLDPPTMLFFKMRGFTYEICLTFHIYLFSHSLFTALLVASIMVLLLYIFDWINVITITEYGTVF